MTLYVVTDWMGLIPIGVCFFFAIWGLIQLIKRKSILKVDKDILLLGAFYIAVISFYSLFEFLVINYRPVLINGNLEASYPSSTTMLSICVFISAIMALFNRVKGAGNKGIIIATFSLLTAFMVIARIISGVHWISDIIGGVLISCALIFTYGFALKMLK